MKQDKLSTIILIAYLLVCTVVFQVNASTKLISSVFLIIWAVIFAVKYGTFKGKENKNDEQWGFGEKNTKELSNS